MGVSDRALYLDVTHNFIPAIVAISLAAIMLERVTVRVIAATLVLLLAEAINWGEAMYAMHLVAPYTGRGGVFEQVSYELNYFADVLTHGFIRIQEVRAIWIGLGSVILLWIMKADLRIRAASAFLVSLGLIISLCCSLGELSA